MKLKIKLDDPKSCIGCPCLNYLIPECFLYGEFFSSMYLDKKNNNVIRPIKCIDENGESPL